MAEAVGGPVASEVTEPGGGRGQAPKPELSVVVVIYNIPREAPRTLYSLSAAYQRGIDPDDVRGDRRRQWLDASPRPGGR